MAPTANDDQVGLLTEALKAIRTGAWTGPGSVDAIYCALKGGLDAPDYAPTFPSAVLSTQSSEFSPSTKAEADPNSKSQIPSTEPEGLIRNGAYWSDPNYEADLTRYSNRVGQLLGPAIARFARAQSRLEVGNGQQFSTPYNFANTGNTDSNPRTGGGFASPEAAADAWVAFVTNNGGPTRYQAFLDAGAAGAGVATLAQLIWQAGYATDPDYPAKVAALAD